MKKETKNKLLYAWLFCDENDKSTEFMIQYMQDEANVSLDCVMNFIEKTTIEERLQFAHSVREANREQAEHERLSALYKFDEGGFCDGFPSV